MAKSKEISDMFDKYRQIPNDKTYSLKELPILKQNFIKKLTPEQKNIKIIKYGI